MSVIFDASFSRFGKRAEGIIDLSAESALPLVRKYGKDIDFIIVSNSYSGEYNGVSGINNLVSTRLSLDSIPSVRVDNTSGSGGSAILVAHSMIEAGVAQNILVIGAEKMTSYPTRKSTSIIASLLHPEERAAGLSLPSLAAFMTKAYLREFDAPRESVARIAVKNHHNGSLNPYAHFQSEVSLDEVMNSRVIADPLRIYEFCPVSDGSVSIMMTSEENASSMSGDYVEILGTGAASGTSSISARQSLTSIESVKRASEMAFRRSGVKPSYVDVAELHDMAAILEIVESEDAGFFRKGHGWEAVMNGETEISGSLPINASGGLNSKGHPIGASGVAQAAEIFLQITGGAGRRQVKDARIGFSLSMAGFGNNATAVVYGGAS